MASITIFHTSDMHNHLNQDYANRLHNIKAKYPNSLMLDSGDAIWAGNVFWRLGGEPILDLMNQVPYDCMCMGNREYHFLSKGIQSKTSKAQFPVLSANICSSDNVKPIKTLPYVEYELNGLKIAVFGLTVPCITEKMAVKKISDYYFIQPKKAAKELVPKLRERNDIVIGLTHIGIAKDREVANEVDGIDLILGGHTHTVTNTPEIINNTYIIHHGCYLQFLGKIELTKNKARIDLQNELITMAKA